MAITSTLNRQTDLKMWNKVQFAIWAAFAEEEGHDVNNGEMFTKFGRFFFDYWEAYEGRAIPDIDTVIRFFRDYKAVCREFGWQAEEFEGFDAFAEAFFEFKARDGGAPHQEDILEILTD